MPFKRACRAKSSVRRLGPVFGKFEPPYGYTARKTVMEGTLIRRFLYVDLHLAANQL